MKIKDITISIFAIIGFVTILSSFNNQTQETHSTVPESHVWELIIADGNENRPYAINKVTGEVRKYNRGGANEKRSNQYLIMVETAGK